MVKCALRLTAPHAAHQQIRAVAAQPGTPTAIAKPKQCTSCTARATCALALFDMCAAGTGHAAPNRPKSITRSKHCHPCAGAHKCVCVCACVCTRMCMCVYMCVCRPMLIFEALTGSSRCKHASRMHTHIHTQIWIYGRESWPPAQPNP